MKEKEKEQIESAVAPAPTGKLNKYDVRIIAARLHEAHPGDPAFKGERLRTATRDALIGQGADVDEATMDEAWEGIHV